jgi:hypothetical protein
MSVAGVNSSSAFNQLTNLQTLFQQGRSDWRQLAQSLRSGDLAGAQQAYNDLVALRQDVPSSGQFSNSRVARDFNALGQALQAGDLAGARQAFSTLRRDAIGRQPFPTGYYFPNASRQNASRGPDIIVNLSSGSAAGSVPATPASSGNNAGTSLAPITSTVGTATSVPTTTPTSPTDNSTNAGSSIPEIIFNLDGGNHHGTSPAQEIIFNLGKGGGNTAAGITLSVNNSSSGSEVDVQIGNGPEIALNFGNGNSGGPDIIFNLGNSGQAQASGVQINVQA